MCLSSIALQVAVVLSMKIQQAQHKHPRQLQVKID